MSAQKIHLNGAEFVPDISGALFWPARQTLIASDLHLEKGSAFAARGTLLPPYDSIATLARLADVMARLSPAHVILAGDTFHDGKALSRMTAEAADRLEKLVASGPRFTFIAGNHDPEAAYFAAAAVTDEWREEHIIIRHEPHFMAALGEIAGHLHPVASIDVRGRRLRRRCFVCDGTRLLLPAFGAYAGGLDVFDDGFAGIFPDGFDAVLIGGSQLYRFTSRQLARDAV
ncbi:MAG TPA: ligase-associated DNA damage response endonuclease PdeM [Micropepsaceae bacterium]|nr:ligase-associated DNA damage response endonuclease PdeM [Micropepsaceae bacterium]